MQRLSEGQPCDITGIQGYQHLDEEGGIQWPLPGADGSINCERRLFENHKFHTPSGKAKFLFDPPSPLPEATTGAYPLTLLTGRGTSAQWHTQSRTKQSAVLRKLYPATLLLDLHPDDAGPLGINDRDPVIITSKRASIPALAHLTTSVRPGEVFLPMHEGLVNRLTFPAFDPHSRQPSYKACAVKVTIDRA